MTASNDPFGAAATFDTALGQRAVYQLGALGEQVNRLPYCIKVLLEACLRNCDGYIVTEDAVNALANYDATNVGETEIPFKPGRVVLQDFTGVPAVVDLAAMRAAMNRMGGDPQKVNPLVPCDLVIDHSVQVDAFASGMALTINSEKEFERNTERYQFLKWGQQAFDNFRVVPPATGIVHQVNLEYLAKVVWDHAGVGTSVPMLYPDSLVGTDSHTTMINGLGVVGWGVGGIEAEAVMLGQPIYMLIPQVVGFKLTGQLPDGATATDLVLRVTQMLRAHGVVGKFVEFFGPGMQAMPLANRATIANMAPEYGATMGFFPVDDMTLKYLRLTARDENLVQTVEQYCKLQGLWRDDAHDITYTDVLELDMSTVEPALAGPKRPQDRIDLSAMQSQWRSDLDDVFSAPPASAGSVVAPTYSSIAANATIANTERHIDANGYFESDAARLRLTPRHYTYLRISEGCNQKCTFCTIPSIRGKMRSKPIDAICAEARELMQDGAFELNLIGQDTTSFGDDIGYAPGLVGLLEELNSTVAENGGALEQCRQKKAKTAPLEALLLRCLAKDAEDRPQSAGWLAEELRKIEEQVPWTDAEAAQWWEDHDRPTGPVWPPEPATTLDGETIVVDLRS